MPGNSGEESHSVGSTEIPLLLSLLLFPIILRRYHCRHRGSFLNFEESGCFVDCKEKRKLSFTVLLTCACALPQPSHA